jgi:hypothetical protein
MAGKLIEVIEGYYCLPETIKRVVAWPAEDKEMWFFGMLEKAPARLATVEIVYQDGTRHEDAFDTYEEAELVAAKIMNIVNTTLKT